METKLDAAIAKTDEAAARLREELDRVLAKQIASIERCRYMRELRNYARIIMGMN